MKPITDNIKPITDNMLPIEKQKMKQFISDVDTFINLYAHACNTKSAYADLIQELQNDLTNAQKDIDELKATIEDYKAIIRDLNAENDMLECRLKRQDYLIDAVLDAVIEATE